MLRLSSTQIAVMAALVEAPEGDESEAQTVVAAHYTTAQKLNKLGLLDQNSDGVFSPTEYGSLILKREQLSREIDRVNKRIEEEYKNQKPAMTALLRFTKKASR